MRVRLTEIDLPVFHILLVTEIGDGLKDFGYVLKHTKAKISNLFFCPHSITDVCERSLRLLRHASHSGLWDKVSVDLVLECLGQERLCKKRTESLERLYGQTKSIITL